MPTPRFTSSFLATLNIADAHYEFATHTLLLVMNVASRTNPPLPASCLSLKSILQFTHILSRHIFAHNELTEEQALLFELPVAFGFYVRYLFVNIYDVQM